MNYNEQTDALVFELDTLIRRFQDEFDINSYTVAGILDAKRLDVLLETGVAFEADAELDEEVDDDDDNTEGDQTQL